MFATSVFAVPVAREEALPVVMRPNPTRAGVRRAAPISSVPLIVTSDGIPVTFNPNEIGTGPGGLDSNNARRWRRPDADADLYLAKNTRSREQYQGKQFCLHGYQDFNMGSLPNSLRSLPCTDDLHRAAGMESHRLGDAT